MKMLAVFLLAVLVCGLAQGRTVDKCEVKKQLMEVFEKDERLVHRLIYFTEKSTQLNTEAETPLPPGMETLNQAPEDGGLKALGIFQIINRLACQNGTTPSFNVCKLPCSKLVDEDIDDDCRCLKQVLAMPGNDISENEKMLRLRMMNQVFLQQLKEEDPSEYFKDCN